MRIFRPCIALEQGSIDGYQGSSPMGVHHGKVDGNATTHRQSDEMRVVNAQVGQQGVYIGWMAVWSVRGYGRLPKAPQIVPQYLIPLGEHLELVIPQADIQSEAMDEHQGMSCTSQLIIEPSPVHVGKACMYGHGISPS